MSNSDSTQTNVTAIQTPSRRRYVTGSQYAARVFKAIGLLGAGTAAFASAGLMAIVTMAFTFLLLSGEGYIPSWIIAGITLTLAALCALSFRFGLRALRTVQNTEPIVLATRSNAANIPPEEGLVRAVGSPTIQQQQALLRPIQFSSLSDGSVLMRSADADTPVTSVETYSGEGEKAQDNQAVSTIGSSA